MLTNTGKVDEAIAAFDKALQADPTRADAYYWKGVDLMGKATTKGDKMVAPRGHGRSFQQVSGTGAYRQVRRSRQTDAGQHWRFGRNHLRKEQDASQEDNRKKP